MSNDLKKNIQKYKWAKVKIYNTFEEADALRSKLKSEGRLTKVRRCGPKGTNFKVLTGTEIKSNKQAKGEKDAAE